MKFPKPTFSSDIDGSGGDISSGERPEWMPEKFWNTDTDSANIENLAKSYSETEKRLGEITRGGKTSEEWNAETRAEIASELQAKRLEQRPETADQYKYEMPEGLNLPEGSEWQMDESDPLLKWWKETSYQNGLNQEQFDAAVKDYVQMQIDSLPNYEQEMKKLGDNASERIKSVNLFSKANFSEETQKALEGFLVDASGVAMMEEIIDLTKNTQINAPGSPMNVVQIKTKEQIKQMQRDPRYWDSNKREASYVAEVNAAWEAAFPGDQESAPLNAS